jgi:hypothetical protein
MAQHQPTDQITHDERVSYNVYYTVQVYSSRFILLILVMKNIQR